ncbi:protein of unassigned function [Methylobacterium oryzae CBMB20]|uniref:Protein of unassigned function n=1 Tax=Methylobacterium oryzae CBMB20 TaxID=693986 RepID=A0A089NPW4_9HYPH|nr:protein of unassigned function [Methylobacterium oryzae CBMB20]
MGPNGAASAPHAMTGSSAIGSETEFYRSPQHLEGSAPPASEGDALSG